MLLEKLIVPLVADTSKFISGLTEAEKKTTSSMATIGGKLTGIGGNLTKLGAIGTVASVPLMAFGKASVDAASDLNESLSKANVVFGESSSVIESWSKRSASSMGISRQAALEAAGTYGNLFTTMGIGNRASADMSIGLVQLASDLASFNNLDPTDVLDKLRAGMVGETEPLRALGVNLSAASVQAEAMKLKLEKVDGKFTDASLATARYSLIMKQTATAQGDFARTSDGLANSTRIAQATFDNLKASLGDRLLPIVNNLMSRLLPILESLTKLSPVTQNWILIIGGLLIALPVMVTTLGSVISAVGTIMTVFGAGTLATLAPVIGIVAAVIAVGALLYLAWKNNFLGIRDIVGNVIQFISKLWTNTLLPAIQAVWSWMNSTLFPFFKAFGEFLGAVFGLAIRVIAGLWQNVLYPALEKVGNFIKTTFHPVFKSLSDFFNTTLKPVLKDVSDWVGNKLGGAFEKVNKAIKDAIQWLKDMTEKLKNIRLPWFLTPGSPTPFENALVGINNAIKDLNRTALPEFTAGLNISGYTAPKTNNGSNKELSDAINKLAHTKAVDERVLARAIVQEIALQMG